MRAVVDRRVAAFRKRIRFRRADTHRDEARACSLFDATCGRCLCLIGGWLVLIGLAGCQSVGFSAGIGSDPGGTGSDIASASPARTSRTGQSYGRSGRARLKGSDSAARRSATAPTEDEDAAPASRKNSRSIRPVVHEEEAADEVGDGADPLPDPGSEAEEVDDAPRSLPVTSDDPSVDRGTRRIPD